MIPPQIPPVATGQGRRVFRVRLGAWALAFGHVYFVVTAPAAGLILGWRGLALYAISALWMAMTCVALIASDYWVSKWTVRANG